MHASIKVSVLDTVLTITFKNKARGNAIVTWVCESADAYRESLEYLLDQSHIDVLTHGNTLAKRKK